MIDHLITAAGHTAIESLYHKWRSSAKSRQGGVLLRDSLNLITQIRNENLVNKGATRQDAVNLIRDVLEDLRKPNLALYDLHKRNPENFGTFMEMIARADYDLRGPQMTHMQINIMLQGLIADFSLHLIHLGV